MGTRLKHFCWRVGDTAFVCGTPKEHNSLWTVSRFLVTCERCRKVIAAETKPPRAVEPDSDPSFFDAPVRWGRWSDPDGGECVAIYFNAGGVLMVHTNKPLLFVEPERH